MHRVVITGIGPAFYSGINKKQFFDSLYRKERCSCRIPENYCKGYKPKTDWYVPLPDITAMINSDERLYMLENYVNNNVLMSCYTAISAINDANLSQLDENTGVIMGCSVNMHEIISDANVVENLKPLNPMAIPRYMPNANAAYISILYGLHGDSKTVASACASGTHAIGEAYRNIAEGRNTVMICGGSDCFASDNGIILRGFDMIHALTRAEDGVVGAFSDERCGFLFSEGGACCLVLEEYEYALARGADIYAEVTGFECNCDAYHITSMPKEPVYAMKVINKLADNEKIDYYNAHGTGTMVNDSGESKLIHSIWGDKEHQPYITSTKGIIGHTISASGAIEAAVCAYAIKYGKIHGNLLKTPMEDLNLPSDTVETEINTAISASFGFGGHNAGLKFKKIN